MQNKKKNKKNTAKGFSVSIRRFFLDYFLKESMNTFLELSLNEKLDKFPVKTWRISEENPVKSLYEFLSKLLKVIM